MHQPALAFLLPSQLGVEQAGRCWLKHFCDASSIVKRLDHSPGSTFLRFTVQFSGAMSSGGSYSATNIKDDSYGQGGWQHASSYNDSQQPAQDGMTTQPSVGRFTEMEKASCMFVRKPATPTMVLPKDSSSQSASGDIVNLNAVTGAEGKMNKTSWKGKK